MEKQSEIRNTSLEHLMPINKGREEYCLVTHSTDKIKLIHPAEEGIQLNLLEHLEIRRALGGEKRSPMLR